MILSQNIHQLETAFVIITAKVTHTQTEHFQQVFSNDDGHTCELTSSTQRTFWRQTSGV